MFQTRAHCCVLTMTRSRLCRYRASRSNACLDAVSLRQRGAYMRRQRHYSHPAAGPLVRGSSSALHNHMLLPHARRQVCCHNLFAPIIVLTLLLTPARACSCCSAELRDLASAHPGLLVVHFLYTQSEQQQQQQQHGLRMSHALLTSLLPAIRAPLGAWVSGPQRLVDGR